MQRKCKNCQAEFTVRGSNHYLCGSYALKTGCSYTLKAEKMREYARGYKAAKASGELVQKTGKCLDCGESFVVNTARHIRCRQCADARHAKLDLERSRLRSAEKRLHPQKRKPRTVILPYTYAPRECKYHLCKKIFHPTNPTVKYHSDKCAYEAQKLQIGEHQAKVRQYNRETQRRIKAHLQRAKPAKEIKLSPIHLQDIPVGGRFEEVVKRMLGG